MPASPGSTGESAGEHARIIRRCEELPILHPHAAGVDVGASELFVAVSADRDSQPVRSFPTFTRDLNALADWLQQCGIRSVAMESTSVYWIPVYQILESRGQTGACACRQCNERGDCDSQEPQAGKLGLPSITWHSVTSGRTSVFISPSGPFHGACPAQTAGRALLPRLPPGSPSRPAATSAARRAVSTRRRLGFSTRAESSRRLGIWTVFLVLLIALWCYKKL